jgi:hypothetical protein
LHGGDYEELRFETLRCVALVITGVSEENIACIIRVKRIGELGKTIRMHINQAQSISS